ncbi:helix-turn-helix transcriptional regulator [Dehalobacter restrictus]|uniref:helix-turn-helix domain-containing protein n=1 Tax=Dehalobacter restrictus TaxID=55583 RepID=UPI00338FCAEF
MLTFTTEMVANYIKQKGIPIKELSRNTGISEYTLDRSLNKLVRPLRTNEFLTICAFLDKNPNDFKKDKFP